MLVSKNPYVVAARVNIVPKKPYFALKTGEKFAQTFGLTVRSPIMKIWVLLFIKSRRYGVECYRLQVIVILDLLNIQTGCQTYKTRNCRKIEASQQIILNFAVSSRSSKLVIWQTHIFLKYYRQMRENKIVANNGSSIVLYTTEDGNTQLEVKLEQETVWLTQSQMAELCSSQSNQ